MYPACHRRRCRAARAVILAQASRPSPSGCRSGGRCGRGRPAPPPDQLDRAILMRLPPPARAHRRSPPHPVPPAQHQPVSPADTRRAERQRQDSTDRPGRCRSCCCPRNRLWPAYPILQTRSLFWIAARRHSCCRRNYTVTASPYRRCSPNGPRPSCRTRWSGNRKMPQPDRHRALNNCPAGAFAPRGSPIGCGGSLPLIRARHGSGCHSHGRP